jgi:hypothetical protein
VNCRTCKHWKAPEHNAIDYPLERYEDPDNFESAPRDDQHQHRLCRAVKRVDRYDEPKPTPKAFTQDASGYMALLWTAPDFGCVLHEPTTSEVVK